jgi:hypothetical protein
MLIVEDEVKIEERDVVHAQTHDILTRLFALDKSKYPQRCGRLSLRSCRLPLRLTRALSLDSPSAAVVSVTLRLRHTCSPSHILLHRQSIHSAQPLLLARPISLFALSLRTPCFLFPPQRHSLHASPAAGRRVKGDKRGGRREAEETQGAHGAYAGEESK